jgi:predicted acyltransferase (DUF342 family)
MNTDIEKDNRSHRMLKRGIFTRFEALRKRDEEGVALVSTVILSIVIFIIAASLSMTLVNAVNITADSKSQVVTFSSAESGTDYALLGAVANSCEVEGESAADGFAFEVYRSASETAPTGLSDPTLSKGCPRDGDRFITIKSTGSDARGGETEVVSTFRWVIRNLGSTEGAVVAGTGLSNISHLDVYNTDGDLLIEKGDFDCNNTSNIAGDVVVMDGTLKLSNACEIKGSIYASDGVQLANWAKVGGSVYTLGNFSTTNNVIVGGDVRARGNLTINNNSLIKGSVTGSGSGATVLDAATINGSLATGGPVTMGSNARVKGSLLSSSAAGSAFYLSNIEGDLIINGRFVQLQESRVNGNVIAAATGQSNSIAPNTTVGGSIRVGGTISTWGSGPTSGGRFENQTIAAIAPPTFEIPVELTSDFFKWRDYSYNSEDWEIAGYQIETMSSCDFQNRPDLVEQINSRNTPTVFDLRTCPRIEAYGVNFNLRTDIAFILNHGGEKKLEAIKVNAVAGTGDHDFNIFASDDTKDGKASCIAPVDDGNSLKIYGAQFSSDISSFIYSPCMVGFGGTSSLNGQIYAGHAKYAGGGQTAFSYREMFVPGFPVEDAEEAPAAFDADATERVLPILIDRKES